MSRLDTFMGLSPAALKIVEGCGKLHSSGKVKEVEVVISTTCRYSTIKMIPILDPCVLVEVGPYKAGMYSNEYSLSKYTLRDGTIYLEVLQQRIWDSGSVIYTCLADPSGTHLKESEWAEVDLRNQHPGYFEEVII